MRKGRNQWHYLGENLSYALVEFSRLSGGDAQGFLSQIFERYRVEEIPKKAPSTQNTQINQLVMLDKVFGHMHPEDIRQSDAIAYIDKLGKAVANRHIALLRHVLTKCVHWDYLTANPLMRMQYRHPEKARDRIVEPLERWRVMRRAPPLLRYMIWLAYLIGMRRQDMLALGRFDCKKDYLYVSEGKTGKKVRIEWTPSLRRVTKKLIDLSPDHRLFPISDSGFDSAWQRLRKKLQVEGYELFQIKDLRAANAGDTEDAGGDATKNMGHSSRELTQKHYLRKGRIISPIR